MSELARVRSNAWSAGIAALLLCYFGFASFRFQPVTNTFMLGDAIFNYTLRVGGVAMAIVTVLLLTGRLPALMLDAVVSFAIGAGLVTSALLMIAGGGFGVNQLLYVIFGGTFVSAGLRNGRDYLALSSVSRPGTYAARTEEPVTLEGAARSSPDDNDSLVNRMRQRIPRDSSAPLQMEIGLPLDATPARRETAAPSESNTPPPVDPRSSSGGFLASFADDKSSGKNG